MDSRRDFLHPGIGLRLASKIQPGPQPTDLLGRCWQWTGAENGKGYGQIGRKINGETHLLLAHRAMYMVLVGPIPEGQTIDHLCENRGCINPNHMEPVTGKVNTLRGNSGAARNARKVYCNHGHEFTGENTIWTKHGARICRKCRARWQAEWYIRHRKGRPRNH